MCEQRTEERNRFGINYWTDDVIGELRRCEDMKEKGQDRWLKRGSSIDEHLIRGRRLFCGLLMIIGVFNLGLTRLDAERREEALQVR